MPLEAAEWLFAISNGAAIMGGILAVLGTAGIFFFGSVREHYANEKQAELRKGTEDARRDAAQANERAAELNKESGELRLQLEKERTERLKLEQRMAPRRVSQKLRDDIQALVPPDSDTKLHFKVGLNNAEGDRFINEIAAACMAAGWQRERLDGSTVAGGNFPEGISIYVNPQECAGSSLRPAATGLVTALSRAGLISKSPLISDADVPVGTVTLAAGLKPDSVV